MAGVLERINLNVPPEVRKRLREMAKREGRSESDLARALLIRALERASRDEFFRRVARSYTPLMRARDLEIARAFERLGG